MITDDLARELIESHPLDTARVLERLEPDAAWAVLAGLDEDLRPPIVEGFSPDYAARLLFEPDLETAVDIVRALPSEVSADILEHLSEAESERLLSALPSLHADEIEELSEYPEDTVGSVMSPEFVALRESATVADALTRLRRLAMVGRDVNYVYVVDDETRLCGVLVLRDLILAQPVTSLKRLMITNVVKVYTSDELDDVADLLFEKRLMSVPVVDDGETLKGVVFATQLVNELQEEGFEDAQKMFGAGSDEHASSTPSFAIRKRLPWLTVNLATAFLAAAVVGAFNGVIAQITILAAFLPVVAGQGGNAGAQALAVTLRSLALDELDARRPRKLIVKEALVGLTNGLATGVLAGTLAALFSGNVALGFVIAAAMVLNLVMAGVAGAAIPVVMERYGQDPAQSSNIILTTVTDIVGFASFLGLAVAAKGWLLR
ncbi:magnesium transporter [soil metagenome]